MENNNLKIFTQNGRVITDDEDLNKVIRSVEEENNSELAGVIPAIIFNEENPDEKVYLVLLSIYDINENTDDVLREWNIKVGRQATYDYLKELVKNEVIDPNTSFIIAGDLLNTDINRNNVKFEDITPATVFRFLKVMRENKKILDGDEMFSIDDFDINGAAGDKTIFEV